MLIGSTVTDVMAVAAPDMKALKEEMAKEEASGKEPLSKQKVGVVSLFVIAFLFCAEFCQCEVKKNVNMEPRKIKFRLDYSLLKAQR